MPDSEAPLADKPKAALEHYIHEMETLYYPWYETAANRNYYLWSVAQAVAMIAGFGTAIIAGLLREEQFRGFGLGRILLIILPICGSLASTYLVQTRIRDLMALRERGRQRLQYLIELGMARFASAASPAEYTEIHKWLVDEVAAVEGEQTKSFFQIVPSHHDSSKIKIAQPEHESTKVT